MTLPKPHERPALTLAQDAPPEQDRRGDLLNAFSFAVEHGHLLRYCHPWRTWLVWDNRRWARDERGEVMRYAKRTVRNLLIAAAAELDDAKRTELFRHALASQSEPRLRAMVTLAQSEAGIPVVPHELDTDTMLLSVNNGTLDLRTGELREHDPLDLITRLAPVDFDADAACPIFMRFLERIFNGNAELIAFLQRAVGYALTGDTSEQVFFVLWGLGANGKSTLVRVLLDLLRGYGCQAAPDLLLARRWDDQPGHHAGIADLARARFVSVIEVEDGRRLAESLLKQATGGDRLKAKFMGKDWFEFEPEFKLFLACNHRPVVRGTDLAIWRRIYLIPFTVTIPLEEQDRKLPGKLRTELAGILSWCVRGCLEWQRVGLQPPLEVTAATAEYRTTMDLLGDFLAAECYVGNGASVSKKVLYAAFKEWATNSGERVISKKALGQRLQERGFTGGKDTNGQRGHFWRGLGLLEDREECDTCDVSTRIPG